MVPIGYNDPMANTSQIKYERPFTLRGDDEFFAAVSELQKTDESVDTPTKSDVIRRAVIEMRDRRRKTRK